MYLVLADFIQALFCPYIVSCGTGGYGGWSIGFPPPIMPGLAGFRPPGMDAMASLMGSAPMPPTLPGMPAIPPMPFNLMGRPPMIVS